MTRKLSYLLGIILLLGGITWLCIGRIPPRSLTLTRMTTLRQRIMQYARERSQLPATLNDLAPANGKDSSLLDGWNQPFSYTVDKDQTVTLRSLGADARFGGKDDAQDMVGRFVTRDPQGHWVEEASPWEQYPLDPAPERFEDLHDRAVAMGETPEGKVYEKRFSQVLETPLKEQLHACTGKMKLSPPYAVNLVFEVGENGFPHRVIPKPDDVVSICVAHRLTELQGPPPPEPDWLVNVTIEITP